MLVDVKGIIKVLNVSRGTVFKMMRDGMPHKKLSERILRFDTDEVMHWISSRQKSAV